MSLLTRSLLALVLLGTALGVQTALWWHLQSAPPLANVAPKRALADAIPLEIGDFVGQDVEIAENLLYGDDHLKRTYVHKKTGQPITLWMIYSKVGEDRGHHPEICMAVAGQAENPQGRGALDVPGSEVPIQQFLFGRPGRQLWVYYWHYTLKPTREPGTSELQRVYQRLQRRFSSVTLHVSAYDALPQSRELAAEFVTQLDAAFQDDLPENAYRGSDRTPVRRIDGPPPGEEATPTP